MSELKEAQKKSIMGLVIKMLKSFDLSREEYLKRKQEFYEFLYGKREEENDY